MIQARAASTVKNMYRLSSLLPMYVDVCTRYMNVVQVQVYHVPPVCCVCVCTTVPTCVVPCTSTIPTVFIIFINYCISHQLFNSHSQLTLTTYTHNFTNVYRTPSVARSTPHTMNDECSTHMHNICTTISHLLHKLPLFWIPFCS